MASVDTISSRLLDCHKLLMKEDDWVKVTSRMGWHALPPEIRNQIIDEIDDEEDLLVAGFRCIPESLFTSRKERTHTEMYDILINNKNLHPKLRFVILEFFIAVKYLDILKAALSLPEEIKEEEKFIIKKRVYLSIPFLKTKSDYKKIQEMIEHKNSPLNDKEGGEFLHEYFGNMHPHSWAYLVNKGNNLIGHTPENTLQENLISSLPLQISFDEEFETAIMQIMCALPTDYLGSFLIKLINNQAVTLNYPTFFQKLNEHWSVILDNEKGKILAGLIQKSRRSESREVHTQILSVVELNLSSIHSSDMGGILKGVVQSIDSFVKSEESQTQVFNMIERILEEHVISKSHLGKMAKALAWNTALLLTGQLQIQALDMIGCRLEVIYDGDIWGILMGLERSMPFLRSEELPNRVLSMIEHIFMQRAHAISEPQIGKILAGLIHNIQFFESWSLQGRVLDLIENKFNVIHNSDIRKIVEKLVHKISDFRLYTLQSRGLNMLERMRKEHIISESEMREMVEELAHKLSSLQSEALQSRVMDRLEPMLELNAMSNPQKREEIVEVLASQISSFEFEALQTRVFNVIKRNLQVIQGSDIGGTLSGLARNVPSLKSKVLQLQVLELLANMVKLHARDIPRSEMREIAVELVRSIASFRSRSGESQVLDMLELMLERMLQMDILSPREMPKIAKKLVRHISSLSETLQFQILNLLERALHSEKWGISEKWKIYYALASHISSLSEALQLQILDLLKSMLKRNAMSDAPREGIVEQLARHILLLKSEALQLQVLDLLEKMLEQDAMFEVERRDIIVQLAQNILSSKSEALQLQALNLLEANLFKLRTITAEEMRTILWELASNVSAFNPEASQSRIFLLIRNHLDRVSGWSKWEILQQLATRVKCLNKNNRHQVVRLLESYCIHEQNHPPSWSRAYGYCKGTIDAHTSLFRKTLLRVSAAFQNAWKWFLERIPSAFRVHIF